MAHVYSRMKSSKRAVKDTVFDILYFWAIIGTRFREVAGSRYRDFAEKIISGRHYYCIEICPWTDRGFFVICDRGGLKNKSVGKNYSTSDFSVVNSEKIS